MIKFYKKVFQIFYRVTDNSEAGNKGNFPQHMAFAGTAVLCAFNLFTLFLLIKVFIFKKSWVSGDKIYLAIIGMGTLAYCYFLFLHDDNYKKYINLNINKTTQKRGNWFLILYIFISLFLLVAVPVLFRSLKYGFLK